MFKKILVLLALVAVVGVVIYAPDLRQKKWQSTREGSESQKQEESSLPREEWSDEEKQAIQEAEAVDESTFDNKLELRKIRKVPNTNVALAAVFKQRVNETCESVNEGEPMRLTKYTGRLTPRDAVRTESLMSTRRGFLTVGLNMQDSDKRTLPMLSKPLILRYLDSHYISLQARISKDPSSDQWLLHYRPLAAVGSLGAVPLTQQIEESIETTVKDIRGLGIYEVPGQKDGSQTAVILFRSDWLNKESQTVSPRFELLIIHATPTEGNGSSDPFRLDVFTTSEQRTVWHHFPNPTHKDLRSVNKCDLFATILFDQFQQDGLHPKSSVTRLLKVNAPSTFQSTAIDAYLGEENKRGGWPANLKEAIDGMIKGHVARIN